jgi:hypothetical protein
MVSRSYSIISAGERAVRPAIACLDELTRLHALLTLRFNLLNRGVAH